MSLFPDEDTHAVAERLNSFHLQDFPVRSLNDEEVRLLVNEWHRCRSKIAEPLHAWLGWTEEQLVRWQESGLLPEAEAS